MYIQLGLDKPIWEQYLIFVGNMLQGDFGNSVMTTRPVLEDIKRFFPATLELATIATLVGIIIGVPAGVWAAVKQGTIVDHIVRVIGLLGHSIPIFWLGMVALLVFYAKLDRWPGASRLLL